MASAQMLSPVNVFGRSADVGALTYQILGVLDGAKVEVAVDGSRITGAAASGSPLQIRISTAHLRGPGGDAQRKGMAAWLEGSAIDGPGLASALGMLDELVTSVAFLIGADATAEDVDDLVALAVDCAGWVDGFVLAMADGVILGPDGSVWAEPVAAPVGEPVSADGPWPGHDPTAGDGGSAEQATTSDGEGAAHDGDGDIEDPFVVEARRMLAEGITDGAVIVDGALGGFVDDTPGLAGATEPDPPTLDRVRARAIVVAAVAARCLNEIDGDHLVEARSALLDWVEETGAAGELEAWEAQILAAEPGTIDERDLLNGSWMTEGAGILAWALGTYDLPPQDRLAEPGEVFGSLGLADPTLTDAAIDLGRAREPEEAESLRRRLLTIHRRLRQHTSTPGPVDLRAVVGEAWGPDALDGLDLADGDLAIGGEPVTDADPELVGLAMSIAVERHRAINWITNGGSFADTDVST